MELLITSNIVSMKKYILWIPMLLAISFISCSDNDIDMNPNEFLGNPTMEVTPTVMSLPQTGGTSKVEVTTNTLWWTTTSNASWLVAPSDTIKGNNSFDLVIPANNSTDTRIGVVTLQSGTKGPKSTVTITQKGLPSHVSVSTSQIDTDGYGGEYTINVTSDATWTVNLKNITDISTSWVTVSPTTGFGNGVVTVKIAKNTNEALQLIQGTLTISVADESATVAINQTGSAASDDPDNTATIYFDDFSPTANVAVGSTWTLTDPRDEQTYRVRLMADGRIWMVDDLKFRGNTGDQKSDLTIFNGNGSETKGVGIPEYWGDVCNPVGVDTNRGYFYNWQATMQSVSARSAGGYSTSVIEESPYQGIAPDGWQVPSVSDYETLSAKLSASDWASQFEVVYGGNCNHGDVKYGGIVIMGQSNFGAYWTITQQNRTSTEGSAANNYIGTWNITTAGVAKAIYSGSVTTTSANRNYGYAVRLMMQTK